MLNKGGGGQNGQYLAYVISEWYSGFYSTPKKNEGKNGGTVLIKQLRFSL